MIMLYRNRQKLAQQLYLNGNRNLATTRQLRRSGMDYYFARNSFSSTVLAAPVFTGHLSKWYDTGERQNYRSYLYSNYRGRYLKIAWSNIALNLNSRAFLIANHRYLYNYFASSRDFNQKHLLSLAHLFANRMSVIVFLKNNQFANFETSR